MQVRQLHGGVMGCDVMSIPCSPLVICLHDPLSERDLAKSKSEACKGENDKAIMI